ncbi:molybdate ABC transporter substrate-binding protein [Corynebacterium alimapuense]|uniref:Molybdate ABC transporter substrate-binding protein n=2 Tax=Corynebacterium alimapuense TaxID=1576874 RepID=A0A3M8K6C5_9CORY|nr:molybdate ABC transporter substrate-binding protein [Corynebacterium alimapuense]
MVPIISIGLVSSCASPQTSGITVLGAASTRVLNDDLETLSEQPLAFINAGSSTLVQQLADGAPGDVLITADQASMDIALAQDSISQPQVLATNSLVMVVPAGNPGEIDSVTDLPGTVLVLCDVQVPCGAASAALAQDNNIELAPSSLEHSVSDVLGKVVSGQADAGWVYLTDAAAAGDAVEVIEIPGADHHHTEVVAAVTTSAEDVAGANRFLDLLTSAEMSQVWLDHGFGPVD